MAKCFNIRAGEIKGFDLTGMSFTVKAGKIKGNNKKTLLLPIFFN